MCGPAPTGPALTAAAGQLITAATSPCACSVHYRSGIKARCASGLHAPAWFDIDPDADAVRVRETFGIAKTQLASRMAVELS